MDLGTLARENAPALEEDFRALSSGFPWILRFSTWIRRKSWPAINIDSRALVDFLTRGSLLNVYQLAARDAAGDPGLAANLVKTDLDVGLDLRILLDATIEGGFEHLYGHVHAGGDGAVWYGPYCAVLKPPPSGISVTALIARDSLDLSHRYFMPGAVRVHVDKIRVESSTWENRHVLAALKHGRCQGPPDERMWPTLLSCGSDYLEVRIVGPVNIDQLRAIVVEDKKWQEWTTRAKRIESLLEKKSFQRIREIADHRSIPFVRSAEYLPSEHP